ncbi:MAG: hypothetical protein RI936_14 [Pseudomonadota bacterium]|jgi:hypothetical protein
MTQRVPLDVQADAVDRAIREIAARRRDPALAAAALTLRLLAGHEDGLRTLIRHLLTFRAHTVPDDALAAALLRDPAVTAVIDAFPGATIVGVAPLTPPDPDTSPVALEATP